MLDYDLELPLKLRERLKAPFGVLVEGRHPESSLRVKRMLEERGGSVRVVAVGDVVAKTLLEVGVEPDIIVVDGKTLRTIGLKLNLDGWEKLNLRNPPGTIKKEAWRVFEDAYSRAGRVCVEVDGEEDLLTIPAALLAPEETIIIYGQPGQGLVVLEADEDAKKRVMSIIKEMREASRDGSETCFSK
ncbi:MAG: GTP-dependent dephospho-CoA kinase family protein [Candidatus Jordarchaeales archaeon]|nr:GTP-dependent dephospho-CoA kinase family protein [Candidatus Jordarchaeia archaeon]